MIRRLTDPKHVPKLIQYARGWHAKSVTSNIPLDVKKSERLIRAAMVEQDVGAIWASFIGNKVRGFLIGALIEWPYLEGKLATDFAFVADSSGRELYRAFEQWAKAHGANAIRMEVSSGLPQANEFYESVGLKNVGGVYYREVTK
jgi:GNAT superfamily N-acetyltransferase